MRCLGKVSHLQYGLAFSSPPFESGRASRLDVGMSPATYYYAVRSLTGLASTYCIASLTAVTIPRLETENQPTSAVQCRVVTTHSQVVVLLPLSATETVKNMKSVVRRYRIQARRHRRQSYMMAASGPVRPSGIRYFRASSPACLVGARAPRPRKPSRNRAELNHRSGQSAQTNCAVLHDNLQNLTARINRIKRWPLNQMW